MRSTDEEKRRFDLSARLKPGERNEKRFTCIHPKKRNISEFPVLKDSLPGSCDYHVCDYKTISETGDHVNFMAALRMTLSTEDEIKLWLKSHTVTWRVDRTYPGKGQKVLFKVDFRCQHKTRPRGVEKVPGRSKNTNCPAKMTVTLLRTQVSRGRRSLSTDPHVPTFPTIVTICSDHNHNICVAEALSHRDMGDKIEHQAAVILLHRVPSAIFLPQTAETRTKILYILTAKDNVSLQFLQPSREEVVPSTGTDLVMVAEEAEQAGSEEVSHQAAAAGFAEMCQELSAIINSDSSFTASSVAAVKAFKKIKDDPSKIITALQMFGRDTNTDLASVGSRIICRAARHAGAAIHAQPTAEGRRRVRLGGRRRLAAGRPNKVTTGPDHVYGQSAKRVRTLAPLYLAHSASEGKNHPK